VKLYIVLIKLNSERRNNCTTDRKSPNRLYHTNKTCLLIQKKASVKVTILFDKTLPISILTQLPPLTNMR